MTIRNKYVDRLYQEWKQHGRIIIGLDYDDTVSPWKFKSELDLIDLDKTINLIRVARETGAYVMIHSSCNLDRYPEITEYCKSKGLIIDSINRNTIELPYGKDGAKPYCNIYIDDRAGLNEALDILETAMYKIRAEKATENLIDVG